MSDRPRSRDERRCAKNRQKIMQNVLENYQMLTDVELQQRKPAILEDILAWTSETVTSSQGPALPDKAALLVQLHDLVHGGGTGLVNAGQIVDPVQQQLTATHQAPVTQLLGRLLGCKAEDLAFTYTEQSAADKKRQPANSQAGKPTTETTLLPPDRIERDSALEQLYPEKVVHVRTVRSLRHQVYQTIFQRLHEQLDSKEGQDALAKALADHILKAPGLCHTVAEKQQRLYSLHKSLTQAPATHLWHGEGLPDQQRLRDSIQLLAGQLAGAHKARLWNDTQKMPALRKMAWEQIRKEVLALLEKKAEAQEGASAVPE